MNNDEPFICPTDEGFFAIPGTCSSDYYVCIKGVPYVSVNNKTLGDSLRSQKLYLQAIHLPHDSMISKTCPAGAIFDPVLLECIPPELASCCEYYRIVFVYIFRFTHILPYYYTV